MLTGIADLELLPAFSGRMDIRDQISALFGEAKTVRASIAFWTLSPDQLNTMTKGNGIGVLRKKESFLCVDIQYPTNIDRLAKLVSLGIEIFLNIRKLPKALDRLRISTSPGLLHTKVLLADMANDQAQFWIGSHNWTVPALIGPNTEMSVAFKLSNRAPLYQEAKFRIEDIRDNYCQPFDPNKVDYYKALQRSLRDTSSKNVVEIEGDNVSDLAGDVICVFGVELDDFEKLSSAGKKVSLSVYDSGGKGKYLYQGRILQTGLLKSANRRADGLALSARRFAYTARRSFPHLGPAAVPGQDVLDKAQFFVNFEVLAFDTSEYRLYDPPPPSRRTSRWARSGSDPAFERMDSDLIDAFYERREPIQGLIEIPSDDERAVTSESFRDEMLVEYSDMPLEQRRDGGNYRLISKKIIEYEP